MVYYAGLDVSVKTTSVCVIDDAGKVILEQKVPTEPAEIIAVLTSLGVPFGRIGIEAGSLSQWLVNALTAADLPVICVETRHMKALLTAQQINKTDRNDARGIAQMMRVGLFKPVHVKTLVAQEQRMLLDMVRGDLVCRRLMTAPGVGAVVALTYRATVDQPQRFVHSRAVGRACRPDAKALPVRRDRLRRRGVQMWRRPATHNALRSRTLTAYLQ